MTLEVLSSGDSFGDLALTGGESRRSASAVCLDKVETISIRQPEFDELRRRLPAVDRFLVEVLSAQVRRLTSLLLDSLHLDADTRTYPPTAPPRDRLRSGPATDSDSTHPGRPRIDGRDDPSDHQQGPANLRPSEDSYHWPEDASPSSTWKVSQNRPNSEHRDSISGFLDVTA